MNQQKASAGKLIPVLREGVMVVKMVLYKEIKACLAKENETAPVEDIGQLAGDIVNDIFGSSTETGPDSAVRGRRGEVGGEAGRIGDLFPKLKIPVTDALRIQFLCDSLEGIDSEDVLTRARDRGILLMDRDIPFPKNFMNMTRKLGVAYGLLIEQEIKED